MILDKNIKRFCSDCGSENIKLDLFENCRFRCLDCFSFNIEAYIEIGTSETESIENNIIKSRYDILDI